MLTVTKKQPVVNLTMSDGTFLGFISSMDLAKGPYVVFGKGWAIERNSKNSLCGFLYSDISRSSRPSANCDPATALTELLPKTVGVK